MGTQITITTDDAALAADLVELINSREGAAPTVTATATPAPAKKAAAKKAAAPVPTPDPEPEADADDDVLGGDDEEPTEYTMADAVARATELVQASKATQVKEALADLGVAKVSHLKADQIGEFMTAVEGL